MKVNRQNRRRQAIMRNQQQRRATAQQRFIEPLTGKRARKIAHSYAQTEYRPVERQIRSEIRGSAKRDKELGEWFGQLAAETAKQGEAASNAYKTAQDATTARLAQAGQQGQANLKDLQATDSRFAELVNAPKNSGGLSQMAEAAAAADRQRVALNQPVTELGANYLASIGPQVRSAQLGGIQARKEEQTRRSKMQQDLQSAGRERGAKQVQHLSELRTGERQYQLENKALAGKNSYNKALNLQSRLGYKGKLASANAQVTAAGIYAQAQEKGASVQKEIARLNKEGKYRTAEALENQAKTYGENAAKGGYNVREAMGLLGSSGKNFKSPEAMVNYLVNRGVKLGIARKAVQKATH